MGEPVYVLEELRSIHKRISYLKERVLEQESEEEEEFEILDISSVGGIEYKEIRSLLFEISTVQRDIKLMLMDSHPERIKEVLEMNKRILKLNYEELEKEYNARKKLLEPKTTTIQRMKSQDNSIYQQKNPWD